MNAINRSIELKDSFRVRPLFLLTCIAIATLLLLPDALRGQRTMQWLVFTSACLAIVLACFFYIRRRESNGNWRNLITVVTTICLIASTPVFFFEFSQVRWLMRGPRWASFYVLPWVHWGFLLIPLTVVGSFFGRGRVRIALVIASILLIALWQSMGPWVF
jgi:hypothetical protein